MCSGANGDNAVHVCIVVHDALKKKQLKIIAILIAAFKFMVILLILKDDYSLLQCISYLQLVPPHTYTHALAVPLVLFINLVI